MAKIMMVLMMGIFLFPSCSPAHQQEIVQKQTLADSTSFYTMEIEFPEDSRDAEKAMKTYFTQIFEAKKEGWKIGGELQTTEQKLNVEFPDRAAIKYEYFVNYETLKTSDNKYVSYVFYKFEYTGGANGMSTVSSFVFSKDKKQVKVEDILDLADSRDISLSKVLAAEALKDTAVFVADFVNQGLGVAYLKSDGKTLDLEKCGCDGFLFSSNFQNFAVTDKGMLFYFDKYTLAPGAAGITHVLLSWDKLQPYLIK